MGVDYEDLPFRVRPDLTPYLIHFTKDNFVRNECDYYKEYMSTSFVTIWSMEDIPQVIEEFRRRLNNHIDLFNKNASQWTLDFFENVEIHIARFAIDKIQ